jgi:hypothetical protein
VIELWRDRLDHSTAQAFSGQQFRGWGGAFCGKEAGTAIYQPEPVCNWPKTIQTIGET